MTTIDLVLQRVAELHDERQRLYAQSSSRISPEERHRLHFIEIELIGIAPILAQSLNLVIGKLRLDDRCWPELRPAGKTSIRTVEWGSIMEELRRDLERAGLR